MSTIQAMMYERIARIIEDRAKLLDEFLMLHESKLKTHQLCVFRDGMDEHCALIPSDEVGTVPVSRFGEYPSIKFGVRI